MPLMSRPELDQEAIRATLLRAAGADRRTCDSGGHAAFPGEPEEIRLPRRAGNYPIELRDHMPLADFLQFHDKEFVANTYQGLFRRPADPGGFAHYLGLLRSGRLSKIDILGKMRYSTEGRRHRVRVDGLLGRYVFRALCRVPLLGYGLKLGHHLLRLPAIVRHLEEYNTFSSARFEQVRQHERHLTESLEGHLNRLQTLMDPSRIRIELVALQRQLEAKAGSQDLVSLRQEMDGKVVKMLTPLREQLEMKAEALQKQQAVLSSEIEKISRRFRTESRERAVAVEARFAEIYVLQQKLAQLAAAVEDLRARHIDCADETFAALYEDFEQAFRGPEAFVKERLAFYLPYVERVSVEDGAPLLDLGCGRGEWLEMLRELGIPALGVDLSETHVAAATARGLTVARGDALDYLRRQPAASFAAVTGFHLIEHLPPGILMQLFTQVYRVLRSGGVAFFETPNPDNVLVGSCNFYLDPTHRNPLPWPLSKFLLEHNGFTSVEVNPLNPSSSSRLPELGAVEERFNHHFYDAMDYGIIGWKGKVV